MKIKLMIYGSIILLITYIVFILISINIFIGNSGFHILNIILSYAFSLLLNLFFIIILYFIILRPLNDIIDYTKNMIEDKAVTELKNCGTLDDFANNISVLRTELIKTKINELNAHKNNKEIISSLNHNIKTPIQSIREIAELLQARTEPGKEKSQLEAISAKAEYVGNLIIEILKRSETDADEIDIEFTEASSIDLYEMISNADYDKNCSYIGAIPKCNVIYDVIRLQQVIDNIISNCYKYAGNRISILSNLTDNFLQITFRDYGNGVNPEEISKIFEKYYRGSNSANRSGSGLGLFLSAHYLERMGGTISCENFTGGFGVTISLQRIDKTPAEQLVL